MSTAVLIPARLDSKRLPRKLLLEKNGKPLLVHCYEALKPVNPWGIPIDRPHATVLTPDKEIVEVCKKYKIPVLLTPNCARNGTELVKYFASNPNSYDKYINVQADTILENGSHLISKIEFQLQEHEIVTPYYSNYDEKEILAPNTGKCVVQENTALYVSRKAIPVQATTPYYCHVGVYGVQRDALLELPSVCDKTLEEENLEMLAWMTQFNIRMLWTDKPGISINSQEDYNQWLKE